MYLITNILSIYHNTAGEGLFQEDNIEITFECRIVQVPSVEEKKNKETIGKPSSLP